MFIIMILFLLALFWFMKGFFKFVLPLLVLLFLAKLLLGSLLFVSGNLILFGLCAAFLIWLWSILRGQKRY